MFRLQYTPRFGQHVERLHAQGPRAIAEFLAELADKIGGGPAIVGLLNEHHNRPTPSMIAAARLPRRVAMVRGARQ